MKAKEKLEIFPSKNIDLDGTFIWQIWTIRTTSKGKSTKFVLFYSWILPYSGDKIGWQNTLEEGTNSVNNSKGNVVRISLQRTDFCGSGHTINNFLKELLKGKYLSDIETAETSDIPNDILTLNLGLDENQILNDFAIRPEVILPIEHLLIPWYKKATPSPTDYSVFVNQLFRVQKTELLSFDGFELNIDQSNVIVKSICTHLMNATGFNMIKESAPRIGNIEWYRFPVSDIDFQPFITFENLSAHIVQVCLKPLTTESKNILVRCRLINGEEISLDEIREIEWSKDEVLLDFVSEQPTCEVKITVWEKNNKGSATILFEKSNHLIRTLHTEMSIVEAQINSGRINLLNKLAQKEEDKKTELANYNRSTAASSTQIGGYKNDSWVSSSRTVKDYMKQLYPEKSQSHFFLNGWDEEKGESGQLSFIEWIFKIISGSDRGGLVFIDPYFDMDAIEIFANARTTNTKYHVVTCTQHREKDDQSSTTTPTVDDSLTLKPLEGIITKAAANIREACEQRSALLNNLELYISDLTSVNGGKQQLFHDRYLLILDDNGNPIEGFHLSNSLQGATRKAPLLVTSIPQDILRNVYNYIENLISPLSDAASTKKISINQIWPINTTKKILSTESEPNKVFAPIGKLGEIPEAGFFFSLLLNNTSLKNESQTNIYSNLKLIGLIEEGSSSFVLYKLTPNQLEDFINRTSKLEQSDFNKIIAALGECMARSNYERGEHQSSDGNIISSYSVFEELVEQIKQHKDFANKLLSFLNDFNDTPHFTRRRVRLYNIFKDVNFEKVLESTLGELHYFGGDFFGIEYKYLYATEFLTRCFEDDAVSLLERLINKVELNCWNEAISEVRAGMLLISSIVHHILHYHSAEHIQTQTTLLKSTDFRIRAAGSAVIIQGILHYVNKFYTLNEFTILLKENLCDDEYRICIAAYIAELNISAHSNEKTAHIETSFSLLISDWIGNESLIKRIISILSGRLANNRSYKISKLFLDPLIVTNKISNETCFDYWNDIFERKIDIQINNFEYDTNVDDLNFSSTTDFELTNTIIHYFSHISEVKQLEILENWNKIINPVSEIVKRPLASYVIPCLFSKASGKVYWLTEIIKILITDNLVKDNVLTNCKDLLEEFKTASLKSEKYLRKAFNHDILFLNEKYQNRHNETN